VNLLDKSLLKSMFAMDHERMQQYWEVYDALLAKRLPKLGGDLEKVRDAFWLCFSREPDALELQQCLRFLEQQRKQRQLTGGGEWSALAAVLLNLDERLTRE